MFDTRAAVHVGPWRFGQQFPTYEWGKHSGTVGADGTSIPVHGVLTIFFKMLPDTDEAVGATFTVCDVQEPVVSFGQMLKRGSACSLSCSNM